MKTSKTIPGHDFKRNSGSLRAGFLYQDLVAIETLINFYRNRNLYKWVQIEAEESEFRSIEDVVACRPDGLFELTQVKFTVDPDAPTNRLDWEWLMEVKGDRGTSLLQKWASTTLQHKKAGTLASASLKTDRVPDAEFDMCLKSCKIDVSMLSAEVRAKIEGQIGSHGEVEDFFESFDFVHSLPRIDDFEDNLWQRIATETDKGGWHQFKWMVQQWSMRKGQPYPEGKIKYIHLRQVFSVARSRPIPQDFRVPSSYVVPNEDFDKAFFDEICNSDGLAVLWGPPGSGKSTYLSHCVERVNGKNAVCIRHHYFLSLSDRSEGRFHYHAIGQSLKHQLEEAIPILPSADTGLGNLLEAGARQLKRENRRLIVIIDGLDHVWRDHRDHEDMETLFDALLPLPPNVRLVVGTQRIEGKHLPAKLLNAVPFEQWIELPLMSYAAVHYWLRFQDRAGRLHLTESGRERRGRVFGKVARSFHNISHGLPLHLIYSFEDVVQTGRAIEAEDVASLPACPSGDIRDYYRSIWERADAKAKTVLHVLAGLEFGPPPSALHDCFGRSDESTAAFATIYHLLDDQGTEIRPFHGSLFAFLRDLSGHEETFRAHATDVLDWLETRAPDYWRWAWLWITKAQLGNSADLLARPDRDWAISSLTAGYPIEQLSAILDSAEKVALDAFDLPRLLCLRSLKERTIDGPTFQTNNWPLFREVAVSLSQDPEVWSVLRAELHRAPAALLSFVVGSSEQTQREQLAQDAIRELIRRATSYDIETDGYNRRSELVHAIASVTANTDPKNFERVKALEKKNVRSSYALVATYSRASLLAANLANVFEAGKFCTHPRTDRDVLAALCLEGLAPSSMPDLKGLTHPAIRCFALTKDGRAEQSRTNRDLSHLFSEGVGPDPESVHEIRFALYEAFFAALAAGLAGNNAQEWSEIPQIAESTWLGQAVRALEQLAGHIAEQWHTSRKWPKLKDIYEVIELCPPTSTSFGERSNFIAVRLALRDAAVDLCTIAIGLDANAQIGASDVKMASMSPFWLDELWLEAFSERCLPLHTTEAAREIVRSVGGHLDSEVTEFNERATGAVKLAKFASIHDLVSLAKKELRRAAACLLGYGWHKDLTAFEVLSSLELLAERGDSLARKAILDFSGEFEAITDYTDGDETEYAREYHYKAIVKYFPERVPFCYSYLIRNEEWRYAEVLATSIVESDLLESRFGQALLESYIDPSEVSALEAAQLASRPITKTALTVVRRKIGKSAEGFSGKDGKSGNGILDFEVDDTTPSEAKDQIPFPEEFPPGNLHAYLTAIRDVSSYHVRRRLVIAWLEFWGATVRNKEALSEYESATTDTVAYSDFDLELENAIDTAFDIALKTQGRTKAYRWLISAHVKRWGWSRWYTSNSEAHTRFRMVANHYRERWQEFITDTAKPGFPVGATRNGIDIGRFRLVHFLVEVGQLDLARALALEMARIFREEVREQPIEMPEWSK